MQKRNTSLWIPSPSPFKIIVYFGVLYVAFKELHNISLPFLCTLFSSFPQPEQCSELLWSLYLFFMTSILPSLLSPYTNLAHPSRPMLLYELLPLWLTIATLILSLLHGHCLHGPSHRFNIYFSLRLKLKHLEEVLFSLIFVSTTLPGTFWLLVNIYLLNLLIEYDSFLKIFLKRKLCIYWKICM